MAGAVSASVERPERSAALPLAGKIAIVTGAAGAIARESAAGCWPTAPTWRPATSNRQALDELAAELSADAAGRIMAVTMDVTDEASVAAGFDEVACAWGGVDLIVVNAGVALVASLTEMKLEAFRKLEKVNVEGSLLTLAEAGRRLCLQGTGGDIVLVSTKNVFAPGAQFGAIAPRRRPRTSWPASPAWSWRHSESASTWSRRTRFSARAAASRDSGPRWGRRGCGPADWMRKGWRNTTGTAIS